MLATLKEILQDNWEWRGQIAKLSWFELVKKSRGAILSWAWFFIRPAIYIFCFWFALEIGLKAAKVSVADGVPYLLWLSSGIIPWFFMQEMLGTGSDVYHSFSYLVTKIKFPLSAIPTINAGAAMIIQLMLQVALFVMYFLCGMPLDPYLIQVPIALFLMFVFWCLFSLFMSHLTAFSKDMANLIKALSTPLFWLSGVIFNVKAIDSAVIQVILQLNPVTFFVTLFRDALVDKVWFWDDPNLCIGFAVVFLLTLVFALLVYKRLSKEVADVL